MCSFFIPTMYKIPDRKISTQDYYFIPIITSIISHQSILVYAQGVNNECTVVIKKSE